MKEKYRFSDFVVIQVRKHTYDSASVKLSISLEFWRLFDSKFIHEPFIMISVKMNTAIHRLIVFNAVLFLNRNMN